MIMEARIICEPTSYDGSESSRVNFVLEVKESELQVIRTWEETLSNKTACSALTANGLRVKLNKDTVRCWGDKNERLCQTY